MPIQDLRFPGAAADFAAVPAALAAANYRYYTRSSAVFQEQSFRDPGIFTQGEMEMCALAAA